MHKFCRWIVLALSIAITSCDSTDTMEDGALDSVPLAMITADDQSQYSSEDEALDSIPLAMITVGDQSQYSEVGGFCWPLSDLALCGSVGEVQTPKSPILVSSPVNLELALPIPDKVDYVQYMVAKVTESDLSDDYTEPNSSGWNIPLENVTAIQPVGVQQLRLDLLPGLYVLKFYAEWSDSRDAGHGFLIEVL